MEFIPPNWLAVIVSAIAVFIMGFLWHGPLFGKLYMKLAGFTQKDKEKAMKKGMGKSYFLSLISTIITAAILGIFINTTSSLGASAGALVGFYAWLGFIAAHTINNVLWRGDKWSLWIFGNVYQLISFLVMGVILGSW